jgi:hypothetical protein
MLDEKFEELYREFEKNIKSINCSIHGGKISLVIVES